MIKKGSRWECVESTRGCVKGEMVKIVSINMSWTDNKIILLDNEKAVLKSELEYCFKPYKPIIKLYEGYPDD